MQQKLSNLSIYEVSGFEIDNLIQLTKSNTTIHELHNRFQYPSRIVQVEFGLE